MSSAEHLDLAHENGYVAGVDRTGPPRGTAEPRGGLSDRVVPAYPLLCQASPATRQALLNVSACLGIASAEPLATLIEFVSAWDPAQGGPAWAGLISITAGACLPRLKSSGALRRVRSWSAERQLREIVHPYFQRFTLSPDTTAERLHRLNFLPAFADEPDYTLLGHRDGTVLERQLWLACQARFDRGKGGWISWAHVDEEVGKVRGRAGGRWVTVEGALLDVGMPKS